MIYFFENQERCLQYSLAGVLIKVTSISIFSKITSKRPYQFACDLFPQPSVVEFNVRGQIFPIERSTLEQMTNSVLDKMETGFQQAVKDKDGRFFIDADGKIFHYILDYIQHRSLPPVEFKAQIVNLSRTLGLTAVERVMMSEKFAQTS